MIHKFLPVTLFIVELSVVYGVTTIVSAYMPSPSGQMEIQPVERREVRIEVVSNGRPSTLATKTNSETIDTNLPVDEASAEEEKQLEGKNDPLPLPPEEETILENLREIQVPSREISQTVPVVPFYSQFRDISSQRWQKVGCGIASLAMLIDFYTGTVEPVDTLLQRGITANAFLENAGWIHVGLIDLSKKYGLTGQSISLAHLSMDNAFTELKKVLRVGPVMASVHYTFEPTNPIPHLVVITGIEDGMVFYNDPAEASGSGSLPIEKFQRAWKKRYIEIRPV